MSKCSKKCNKLCEKIQSISGLDDSYIYGKLAQLEYCVDNIVNAINIYANESSLNGVSDNVRKWFEDD